MRVAALLVAAALATPALAQEEPPKEPAQSTLPVNTPTPPPGESKLDSKVDGLDLHKDEPLIPFLHGWKGGVEVGLNGSEGNSQSLNIHAGANAERKTDLY